jgi:hypothetical protein
MADTDKQAKVKAEFESKIEAKQKEIDGLDEFIIISSVWIGFREIRLPYIKRLLIVACLFPIVLHNGYCAMKFSLPSSDVF